MINESPALNLPAYSMQFSAFTPNQKFFFSFFFPPDKKHFPNLTLTWTLTSPSQKALIVGTWLKQTKLYTAFPSFICTEKECVSRPSPQGTKPHVCFCESLEVKDSWSRKNHFQASHGAELKSGPCCTIFIFVTA